MKWTVVQKNSHYGVSVSLLSVQVTNLNHLENTETLGSCRFVQPNTLPRMENSLYIEVHKLYVEKTSVFITILLYLLETE